MVNVVVAPELTLTIPDGDIEPFEPALAVMVNVFTENVAEIVWLTVMLLKVYVGFVATAPPSTVTVSILYPVFGVMLKTCVDPLATPTVPIGEMAPFAPAEAAMVRMV